MKKYVMILACVSTCAAQQAMVIKPVIDLFFSPEISTYSPASFDKDHTTCPRAHQLLIHDIVEVHEKSGTTYKIEVPDAYYLSAGKLTNTYWTSTDNLVLLTQKPAPYTVTLINPHYEPSLNMLYSHGTQFSRAYESINDQKEIAVHAYDPLHNRWNTIFLPQDSCLKEHSASEQRAIFVKLILDSIEKAEKTDGVIPYVWGGKSFTFAQPDEYLKHTQGFDRSIPAYPVTGFDCSNMVLHYAQLCGIKWPYKSSAALCQYGSERKCGDRIEEGDILWIPGHVMVIMKNKREIIEAAGYKWLYGRIHKIKIKDRFYGTHTIEDILKFYEKNGYIKLYNKNKKSLSVVHNVKIFSLIPS